MRLNNNQTTASLFNVDEELYENLIKELGKIHCIFHPMETNKSLKVDDEYMKRFELLFGVEVV